MQLDVFRGDAFHFSKLIGGINRLPYVPTRIGSMGWFASRGVSTLSVDIEMRDGKLTLVPARPRGAPGDPKNLGRRQIETFKPVHLPQTVHLYADEVQGLRAFGSETETEVAMNYLMEKMAVARRDLDVTHEYHRIGAIKGQVLDADGATVLHDLFAKFNLSPSTHVMPLGSASTKVRTQCTQIARKVENKLGGVMMSGLHYLCGSDFFDLLVDHDDVREQLKWIAPAVNTTDVRQRFEYGGSIFEEYRGSVNGTAFIPTAEAYAVPVGVPDLFQSIYAPANYMETVNTVGVPYYTMSENMPFNKGIDYEVQSNPLHINTRPDSVCRVTLT